MEEEDDPQIKSVDNLLRAPIMLLYIVILMVSCLVLRFFNNMKRAAELHDEALFGEPPPQHCDCPICFIRLPIMDTGKKYMACCGKIFYVLDAATLMCMIISAILL